MCVYMCIPLPLLRNGSVKRYRGNEYTLNESRVVGGVVFYTFRVVSKESIRLVLSRTSCFIFRPNFECAHIVSNLISLLEPLNVGDFTDSPFY
jgi:hypothetical protein